MSQRREFLGAKITGSISYPIDRGTPVSAGTVVLRRCNADLSVFKNCNNRFKQKQR